MNSGLGNPYPQGLSPRFNNDLLDSQLRADLDRSVRKHLEKGKYLQIKCIFWLGVS